MKTLWSRAGILAALTLMPCAAPAVAGTLADGGAGASVGLAAAAATLGPGRYMWQDASTDGAVRVVVNIGEQRAYVYRGPALIAVSTVSTGKDGKETPAGVYPILQKEVMHRSNLYNDARMPYMQRLTWDGIAIHSGANPGFPASHGCIRVPDAFAKKLFAVTQVGSVVEVVGADTTTSDDPLAIDVPEDQSATETARANREIAKDD